MLTKSKSAEPGVSGEFKGFGAPWATFTAACARPGTEALRGNLTGAGQRPYEGSIALQHHSIALGSNAANVGISDPPRGTLLVSATRCG